MATKTAGPNEPAWDLHRNHRTTKVKHPSGKNVDVDELLAPLISLLWVRGLTTYSFCQEEKPGLACIEFAGSSDVEEFLAVAQQDFHVQIETWDEGEWPRHAIRIRLLVLFPTLAIPALTEQFKTATPKRKRKG
jgi:hypothetical protein